MKLKFIKRVAGNDSRLSEETLEKLRKWIKCYPAFTDADMTRMWNSVFLCMWMSDKPLAQEKLAQSLASLLHSFEKKDDSIRFYGGFLQIMAKEWYSIDQRQIDKFKMLFRKVTEQVFVVMHCNKWEKKLIKQLNKHIENSILDKLISIGFLMNFTEIFFDELAKVPVEETLRFNVTLLIRPFAKYLDVPRDNKFVVHIMKHIFDCLLYQGLVGQAFLDKIENWKSMDFPGTFIDNGKIASEDNSAEIHTETAMDTRTNETPLAILNINNKVQEMIDLLKRDLYEPSRQIKKLNKEKRKKLSVDGCTDVPLKRMKLSEVEKMKLKKKKSFSGWVETDLTPEEISNNENKSCPDAVNDPEMENVINSTTGTCYVTEDWDDTPSLDGDVEYVISRSNTKQRLSDANDKWSNVEHCEPKPAVFNPIADKPPKLNRTLTPSVTLSPNASFTPQTPSTPTNAVKTVRIVFELNRSQEESEYIQQLISSPKVPFDSAKKPGKGMLFHQTNGQLG